MKLSAIFVGIAMLGVISTGAFAKVDSLHKEYTHRAPAQQTVQQAKAAYAHKRIALKHPEKMTLLKQKYAEMDKACCAKKQTSTREMKSRFVDKARHTQGTFKHDCPYQRGTAKNTRTHDAKQMQGMKCDKMQAGCCK